MQIIPGGSHTDERGTIRFVNGFDFAGIKRFYSITHPDTRITRAWQGHQRETKYFHVTNGSFLIAWIPVDDWSKPSKNSTVSTEVLSAEMSGILVIDPGHANGFRALEGGSTMLVFSDMTLDETKADDFRWEPGYFDGYAALRGPAACAASGEPGGIDKH